MATKNNKMEDHIVAFVDLLGASAAISKDAQNSLNIVHAAYESAIEKFHEYFEKDGFVPNVKIFSDNIIISIPSDKLKNSSELLAILMLTAILQVEFLVRGFLTRGGVSSGDYFSDEMMVWGTALLKSYNLENSIAIYPRVVIDPDLIAEYRLALPQTESHCKKWIRQDKDGLYFVEYLNPCLKNLMSLLLSLTDKVDERIGENVKSVKVCQKWVWFRSYLTERILECNGEGNNK